MCPKIVIVVLNWNGKCDTIECIKSIFNSSYKDYDIVIVDNGSTYEEGKYLKKELPSVDIIENGINLGFAKGCNVGIRYAIDVKKAEYILLLNNDTIVSPECISELFKTINRNEDIGIVGPLIYNYINYLSIQSASISLKKFSLKNITDYLSEDEVERPFLTGCAMLISASLLSKINGFDEKYFAYWEDLDLCIRTRKEGYRIVLAPKAKIWHKGSMSTGGYLNKKAYYYYIRNSLYFYKKNYSIKIYYTYLMYLLSIYQILLIGYSIINKRFDLWVSYIKGINDSIKMKVD